MLFVSGFVMAVPPDWERETEVRGRRMASADSDTITVGREVSSTIKKKQVELEDIKSYLLELEM